MLSSRIVQSCIDRLQEITHVDLFVVNSTGDVVATTTDETTNARVLADFAASAADSQVILQTHLFKVREEGETVWIVGASGQAESAHMTGRICVEQLLQLMQAYQEKYDRSSFFQNLLLDNLLLVDIYNRARQLHIPDERERVVFLVEEADARQTRQDDPSVQIAELLSSMFGRGGEDCVTRIEQKSVIVVKTVAETEKDRQLKQVADTIVDMVSMEAMRNVRVAYGGKAKSLKELSRSFKEAATAMEVGKIFYEEQKVNAYASLGIGRLIYQLPESLCRMYLKEVFGERNLLEELDEETQMTAREFFKNSLNVSETSRKLFLHRNTLVYRLEKMAKETGIDIRKFDDAMTFRFSMMVARYMRFLDGKG